MIKCLGSHGKVRKYYGKVNESWQLKVEWTLGTEVNFIVVN